MAIVESEVGGRKASERFGFGRARVGRASEWLGRRRCRSERKRESWPDRDPDSASDPVSAPRPREYWAHGPSPGLTTRPHHGGEFGWSDPARKRSWWQCGREAEGDVDYSGVGLLEGRGEQAVQGRGEEGSGDLSRDREIVRWVSRLGAVSVQQIGRRFQLGRSVSYEQVRRLVRFGLLERTQTGIGDPTLISATRDGITYVGLGLRRPTIRLGEVDHWLTCADVAIELEDLYGAGQVVTERELRFEEALAGRPIASAKMGETVNGYPRLHRPDLAIKGRGGYTVYEVELTPKSRHRLQAILRAWRWAKNVERCVYVVPPSSPTQQVVHDAIHRVRAEDEVCVLELGRPLR
jgi:DNA-binding Lrp family transcriptional regulator